MVVKKKRRRNTRKTSRSDSEQSIYGAKQYYSPNDKVDWYGMIGSSKKRYRR